MIPSSLELNSDDFPFFGDLKRTSGSREKLEKSSFENRDNHHWPGGSEMSRWWWWWWWWWWLEKIRKTKIQKKDRNTNTKTNTKTDTHTQIQKNTKYTITKRSWSFWHPRISGSSFISEDMARNPKKWRNPEILKSTIQKFNFFLEIWKALENTVVLTPADLR